MNQVALIYDILYAYYGDLGWWPAKTPYEVMVGAILTQNTAWRNVEKAILNFGGNLSPDMVLSADRAALADIIRPSGFYNQKALYLKEVTRWYQGYGFDIANVKSAPLEKLRAELLALKGVGKETADSILLYAFGFPTFVVDAYTVRLCARFPIDAGKGYDAVKAFFEANLPRDAQAYNRLHAMIVINGKDHCGSKPVCDGCPLSERCSYEGKICAASPRLELLSRRLSDQ